MDIPLMFLSVSFGCVVFTFLGYIVDSQHPAPASLPQREKAAVGLASAIVFFIFFLLSQVW